MPASHVAVFDSNVLITLLIPASLSTRLLARLDAAGWEVAASPQILAEVAEKLRTKSTVRRWLNTTDEDIEDFVSGVLPDLVSLVPGIVQAHRTVPADPKDDKIIAAALESQASYIISEDKHLLNLKQYQGTMIANRQEFEQELDRLGLPR